MSNPVATVAFLQGQAWAKSPDGSLRPLAVGSVLQDNEVVVTAEGARVELDLGNNELVTVQGGQELGMSPDLNTDTATGIDEALLSDASVQEALKVLEEGGDLTETLEETAAGLGGGAGGGGHDFVRLARIVELTENNNYSFQTEAESAADAELRSGTINHAPLVTDQALEGAEDTTISGRILATDVEKGVLIYEVEQGPTSGTLQLDRATGQFIYTPTADYNGPDSFVVTVIDDHGNRTSSRIDLTITPVNDAPVSSDQNLTTLEDTPVDGQVVATDIENDTLSYVVSSPAANGTVSLDAATGVFTYIPNADYNGSDSFIVTIDDGQGGTTTSKITIGVIPVNDAPVSADQNLTTPEDTPLDGQINASDIDKDVLSYSISSPVTHGTVSLNPATGAFTYTPNADYNGSDRFVVTIDDGQGGTTTSTVNIGVTPVNDAPVSADQNLTTPEDTSLAGQVVARDVDGDTLSYNLSTPVTHGTLILNATTGVFTYTPNANYNGSDRFVVTIDDGQGGTTTSTINIGVTPVNDAPVSADQNLITLEDVPINGQVVASDVDGDALNYRVTTTAANGTVSLNAATGAFVYSPNANFNGSDRFVVTVSDGNGGVTSSTINIGVTPVNDDPVANNLSLTTPEDTAVSGAISASDVDGDSLTYNVIGAGPSNGSLSFNSSTGGFVYTPNNTYTGSDSFQVRVSDGQGGSTTSTVSIGVTPVSDPVVNSITSPSAIEGADLSYSVTLSRATTNSLSLPYSLGGGSASAADYGTPTFSNGVTLVGGNLIIPVGVASFSVTVPTVDDVLSESTETLPLIIGGVTGTGSITDNDGTPSLSINNISVNEGAGTATFTVTLSSASSQAVSVNYASSNGTATAGSDYTAVNGTLNFAAGDLTKTITVPITDDSLAEGPENFSITLSTPSNATLGTAVGTGTIVDNDGAPSLSINNISVNEGAGTATFTVTLSAASGQAVTVNYASSNGTATAGSDYTAVNGTLNFAAGDLTKTITVPISDDSLFEGNENFTITLSGASNASIATATGTGTIIDNDLDPSNNAPKAFNDPLVTPYSINLGNTSTDFWGALATKGVNLAFYKANGSAGTMYERGSDHAIGVATSPRTVPGTTVADQIEYDQTTGKSEAIVMNFTKGALSQATFSVSNLFPGENGGEMGAWEVSYQGVIIAANTFRLTGTSDKGTFTIDTGGRVFDSVKFTALNTNNGTGDGGDYFITNFVGSGPGTTTGSYVVNEGGTSVVGSTSSVRLLANDTDADGDTLKVTHINGNPITEGQSISLPSGATLVIHTDGSFSYATNTAYDYLNAGQLATNSFTYSISDGRGGVDTATATMTIVGAGPALSTTGTSGNDTIVGTSGADLIIGGAGNDSLTGALGADTFKWSLADKGSVGAPATDTVIDFSNAQGDVLHLSELLQGENSGNLTNYLHFTYNATANSTTINISSSGAYGTSGYSAALTDQIIVLNGYSTSGSDTDIINQLKAAGRLITD